MKWKALALMVCSMSLSGCFGLTTERALYADVSPCPPQGVRPATLEAISRDRGMATYVVTHGRLAQEHGCAFW